VHNAAKEKAAIGKDLGGERVAPRPKKNTMNRIKDSFTSAWNRTKQYFRGAAKRIRWYFAFMVLLAIVLGILVLFVGWTEAWRFATALGILATFTILCHEVAITFGITPERPTQQTALLSQYEDVLRMQRAAIDSQQKATRATEDALQKVPSPQQDTLKDVLKLQEPAATLQQGTAIQLEATLLQGTGGEVQQHAVLRAVAEAALAAQRQETVVQTLQQTALQNLRLAIPQQSGPQSEALKAAFAAQEQAIRDQEAARNKRATVLGQAAGPSQPYPPGVLGIIVGKDWRWSTSKWMAAMWTYALLFAVISLFLLYGVDGLANKLSPLQLGYLVLIGSPLAAAVLAKGFTAGNAAQSGDPKTTYGAQPGPIPPAPIPLPAGSTPGASGSGTSGASGSGTSGVQVYSGSGTATTPAAGPQLPSVGAGAAQLISTDDGDTDLGDFQYLCFNLILLAYFLFTFFLSPKEGLPDLPETLLALAGVSATGYATSKYFQSSPPPIVNSSNPQRIILGKDVTLDITGSNFGEENPSSMPQLCQVALNGRPLTSGTGRKILAWHPEWIRVNLPLPPEDLQQFVPPRDISGNVVENTNLVVSDRYGRASEPRPVTVDSSFATPSDTSSGSSDTSGSP
jgi:hypothetical protein